MQYAHYYCFFFFIKCATSNHGPPLSFGTVFGNTTLTTNKNKALAMMGAFCKSVYKTKEAEELLDFSKYKRSIFRFFSLMLHSLNIFINLCIQLQLITRKNITGGNGTMVGEGIFLIHCVRRFQTLDMCIPRGLR